MKIRNAIRSGWAATTRGGRKAVEILARALVVGAAGLLALLAKASTASARALVWASRGLDAAARALARARRPAADDVAATGTTTEITILPTPEPAPRPASPPPPPRPSPASPSLPAPPSVPAPPEDRAWQLLIDGVKATAGESGRARPAPAKDPRVAAVVEFHPLVARLPSPRGSGAKGPGAEARAGAVPNREG